MARPSEAASGAVDALLWSRVAVLDAPFPAHPQRRAHTGDGRVVVLHDVTGDLRVAVDAEVTRRMVPRYLSRAAGTADPVQFWSRWTGWEVVAKVTDRPMVGLVRSGALRQEAGGAEVHVTVRRVGDLTVAIGWHRDSAASVLLGDRVGDSFASTTVHGVPALT